MRTSIFSFVTIGILSALMAAAAPTYAQGDSETFHPPIAVPFQLDAPGFVTLVIEDSQGKRVRNLISETAFPAGDNTAWWDGLDDHGRDPDAARHGIYSTPGQLVTPGAYRVRGLFRPQIGAKYLMMPYTNGVPGWNNGKRDSEWLANHTPPQAALFVPEKEADTGAGGHATGGQILVGSYVAEGGSGLAWIDLNGKKLSGQMWIGGVWTGAPYLAHDDGPRPVPNVYAYSASAWENELRLHALVSTVVKGNGTNDHRMGWGDDRPVLTPTFKFPGVGGAWNATSPLAAVSGIAVRNGLVVASLPKMHQILFIDAAAHKTLGTAAVTDPRGVAFDAKGRLLVLSGRSLLRFAIPALTQLADGSEFGAELDRAAFKASASLTGDGSSAQSALADDAKGAWTTAVPQMPGQWYQIDMGTPRLCTSIVLISQADQNFAHGWRLVVSQDGRTWSKPVATGTGAAVEKDKVRFGFTPLVFPRQRARFLRIELTERVPDHRWSINHISVYNGAVKPLPDGNTLVSDLQDPQGITLDPAGNIYVSDHGTSHQVKVYSPQGKLLRVIGHAGAPTAGAYDPLHLNHPAGLTIDGRGRLWVAENDFSPKRISVWNAKTGALLNAYYGPPIYGGGGQLDPQDKTLFYEGGMAFRLDYAAGSSRPVDIFFRAGDDPLQLGHWLPGPQQAIYRNGVRYMTDAFNNSPTNGADFATIWMLGTDGVAHATAALGRANAWPLLKTAPYRTLWPAGIDPDAGNWWYDAGEAACTLFVWNDLNGDGEPEPNEFTLRKAVLGAVTVMPDLSFVESRMDGKVTQFKPARFTAAGAPVYDIDTATALVENAQPNTSTGGDQAMVGKDGWVISDPPVKPYSNTSVGGARNGVPLWEYPNLWAGLHPSHDAPMPDRPGELIGVTRLLGELIAPKGSDAGEMVAWNGNKGNVYLLTADGLFVATLFQDCRTKGFDAPLAVVGQEMTGYSLGEESFWPSITQSEDGNIYLCANGVLMQITGLEGVRRLPPSTLKVSAQSLQQAQAWFTAQEVARQQKAAAQQRPLVVARRATAPALTPDLKDWPKESFVAIDNHTSAAVAIAGDRLYAAFRTGDANLLQNRPQSLQNIFKTGGALDLMIDAIPGGERLLVTQAQGKTLAVLYRPHVAGTTGDPVKFVSNIGTLKTVAMDRVDDVSAQVTLTQDGRGDFIISAPLSLLSFTPQTDIVVHGDIGVLRGNGFQTLQRVYWHNKATGLVSDLATEAELTPALWGVWQIR